MPKNTFTLKEVMLERFDEMGEHLEEIKKQTTKHNDRMNKVEKELGMGTTEPTRLSKLDKTVGNLKGWKIYVMGGWGLLIIISPIMWFVISKGLNNFKNQIDSQIKVGIVEALQDNVSSIEYE